MDWSSRTVKLWFRVFKYSLINAAVSVAIGLFFYYRFGKDVQYYGRYLDLDFFNTVCGIFTIIGLGIALYQIAALKREEEIVKETTERMLTQTFKRENSNRIEGAKKILLDLETTVKSGDFNPASVTAMAGWTEQVIRIYKDVDIQQDGSGGAIIIDCKKCLPF